MKARLDVDKAFRKPGTGDAGKTIGRESAYPVVVGLGASAVSTKGVIDFFENARDLKAACFVLVVQHREARDEAAFLERLALASGMSVSEVKDGERPGPGQILVAGRNIRVSVVTGRFRTSAAQELAGERATIDSFLVSLAESQIEQAVGVVLANVGSDGALGLASLREAGRMTFAERVGGEVPLPTFDDFATTARATADLVLPAEDIPRRIGDYLRSLERPRPARDFDDLVEEYTPQLACIATVLRNRTGYDFDAYGRNSFLRRVQRRIQVTRTETINAYLAFLREVSDEAQGLLNDLLLGVTGFFRDPREFAFLEREIIPRLFEGRTSADQLRVWVLGCVTGEEAYSIAILLREHAARIDAVPHIQIFATDIDGRALAQACVGRYSERAVRAVTPARLGRWFVKEGDTYRVVKELREMCFFSRHDFIKDAPFPQLDLVLCRNLLIYLGAELQDRVIPLFHLALRPGGFLLLGNSENVMRHSTLFAPVDREVGMFRRQESHARALLDFPPTPTPKADRLDDQGAGARGSDPGVVALTERIMERYAPAYMIVDENYDVLHSSGRTERYFDPTTGVASPNLMMLIHRDLRMDIRTALHRAETDKTAVRVAGVRVGRNDHGSNLTVTVEPLDGASGHPARYAVILQDGYVTDEADDGGRAREHGGRHADVERLEAELQLTRDRLQATVELSLQERQKTLLAELQHKVRNSLAIIRSIARRSAETSDSVQDYANHLEGRIEALARTQSTLTRAADAAVNLQTLLLDEFASQSTRDGRRVTIDGPDIFLSGKAAEDLSLVFHELATNSIKYGALGSEKGSLKISWSLESDSVGQSLSIRWVETLPGATARTPQRRGFGSELIERLVPHELHGTGELIFEDSGIVCAIELPLSPMIRLRREKGAEDAAAGR